MGTSVFAGGLEDRDAFGRSGFVLASLEVSLIHYLWMAAYKWLTNNPPTGGELAGGYGWVFPTSG
jgi:hypothetical protein